MLHFSFPLGLHALQLLHCLPVLLQRILPAYLHLSPLFPHSPRLLPVLRYFDLHRLLKWVFPEHRHQRLRTMSNHNVGLHLLLRQHHLPPMPRRLLPLRVNLHSLRPTRLLNLQHNHPHKLHNLQFRLLPKRIHLYHLSSSRLSRLQHNCLSRLSVRVLS